MSEIIKMHAKTCQYLGIGTSSSEKYICKYVSYRLNLEKYKAKAHAVTAYESDYTDYYNIFYSSQSIKTKLRL